MSEESKENLQNEEKSFKKEIINFFKDLAIIIVIVLIVRTFIILPFQISGQSMYDSYYDREYIIVDRLSYLVFKEPVRGDVVVFNTHINGKEYFIKRIIGLPGDTLKIASGSVFIKSAGEEEFIKLDEKYLNETNYGSTYIRGDSSKHTYEVPENEYFVMGDNRTASTDSRSCFSSCEFGDKTNFIEKGDIVGRVFIDLGYFNLKTFSFKQPDLGIDTTPKLFSSASSFDY